MYELVKQVVCSIIAVALGTTAAIVRGPLPLNPPWIERVALLAAQFRALSAGRSADPRDGATDPAPEGPEPTETVADLRNVLSADQQLWDFVPALKAAGISMDKELCERVEREWSVSTLLSYIRNVDRTLQNSAAEAQSAAPRYLVTTRSGEGTAG